MRLILHTRSLSTLIPRGSRLRRSLLAARSARSRLTNEKNERLLAVLSMSGPRAQAPPTKRPGQAALGREWKPLRKCNAESPPYSGTPLIRPTSGHKNLPVLTGRIKFHGWSLHSKINLTNLKLTRNCFFLQSQQYDMLQTIATKRDIVIISQDYLSLVPFIRMYICFV